MISGDRRTAAVKDACRNGYPGQGHMDPLLHVHVVEGVAFSPARTTERPTERPLEGRRRTRTWPADWDWDWDWDLGPDHPPQRARPRVVFVWYSAPCSHARGGQHGRAAYGSTNRSVRHRCRAGSSLERAAPARAPGPGAGRPRRDPTSCSCLGVHLARHVRNPARHASRHPAARPGTADDRGSARPAGDTDQIYPHARVTGAAARHDWWESPAIAIAPAGLMHANLATKMCPLLCIRAMRGLPASRTQYAFAFLY
jgi:hypothetical protein